MLNSNLMMNNMANFQLTDLLERICSKNSDKDQRLQACSALQHLLLNVGDGRQLGKDPFSVIYQLENLFSSRLSSEVKKAAASCLGTMGYIMGYKCKDYVSWLTETYDRMEGGNDDTKQDRKSFYLHALLTTVQNDKLNRKLDEKLVTKITSDVHKYLGAAEDKKLLVPLLNLIGLLASGYPPIFASHFSDVVDILAGWFIESESTSAIFEACERTLKLLQPFWLDNMQSCLDLLSQFMEDAEIYVEDSLKGGTTDNSAEDCILKAAALLRAYKTILESISDYFIVTSENPKFVSFASEALVKTQKCIDGALELSFCEVSELALAAASVFEIMVDICRLESKLIAPHLFRLIAQLCGCMRLEEESLLQVMNLTKKAASKVPPEIMAEFVKVLIGPNGCLRALRFHHCKKIAASVLEIYCALLQPKSISSLQEVYKFVVGEMQACIRVVHRDAGAVITGESSPEMGVPDLPDFPLTGLLSNSATAEWIVTFLCCALTELGNAKSSLIGMWGLSPNQFTLITQKLPVKQKWFICSCRAGHYSLIYILKAHCDKHDHFVSNSDLVVDNTRHQFANAQTGKHLTTILKFLTDLLLQDVLPEETRRLVLLWVQDVMKCAKKLAPPNSILYRSNEFSGLLEGLIHSARHHTSSVPLVQVETLGCVLSSVSKLLDSSFWARVVELCVQCVALGHSVYLKLLANVSFVEIMRADDISRSDDVSCIRNQAEVGCGKMTGTHFSAFMDFLLQSTPLQLVEESHEKLWLENCRIVLSECVSEEAKIDAKMLGPRDVWQWAMWECAQYCVSNRLKTTLGKPIETFSAIENQIRNFANSCVKGVNEEPSKNSQWKSDGEKTLSRNQALQWFLVRCLLNFLECLDKAMFNAYEGSAYALPTPIKTSRTFFRTNRTTCKQWLNRIRVAAMTVALNNQEYAIVVRLANQALMDLEFGKTTPRYSESVELMLILTAEALAKMGCGQAVQGLYAWAKTVLKVRPAWIKPCIHIAYDKYESAVTGFQSLLSAESSEAEENEADPLEENNNGNSTPPKPSSAEEKKFVNSQILDCLLSIRDFQSAKKFIEEFEKRIENSTSGNSQCILNRMSYVKKLGSFDADEGFGKTEAVSEPFGLNWSGREAMEKLEMQFMDCILRQPSERPRQLKKLTIKSNEMEAVKIWSVNPPSLPIEIELVKRFIEIAKNPDQQDFTSDLQIAIDTKQSEAGFLPRQKVVSAVDYWTDLLISQGYSPKIGSPDFQLDASRLARKHGNYKLSGRLLLKHLGVSESTDVANGYIPEKIIEKVSGNLKQQAKLECPGRWLPVARHAAKLICSVDEEKEKGFQLLTEAVTRTLDSGVRAVMPVQGMSEHLLDCVSRSLARLSLETGQGGMREELSRALLKLGEWLMGNNTLGGILLAKSEKEETSESIFIKLLEEQLNLAENFLGALDSGSVVGALLTLSAHICPELSKAQRALADWAYKAGKKAVEGSSRDEHVLLTADELIVVKGAMPLGAPDDETESVIRLVSSLKSEDNPLKNHGDMIEELGRICPSLSFVDTLLDIWDRANRRLFLFYDSAAIAYFTYLRFNPPTNSTTTITATLRLLRLLVKHVQHLHPALQEEFERTHPAPWRCVMPQIFARLNHPSKIVREILFRLLERMALTYPDLVSFPAIIGQAGGSGSWKETLEEENLILGDTTDTEEVSTGLSTEGESLMQNCCQNLVEVIEKIQPELIRDVRIFVEELQRITLLRDEKWLSVLGHLQHEFSKRLKQLSDETDKTMRSGYLTETEKKEIVTLKADVFTRMMFKTLEDLVKKTTSPAETPNEVWFLTQYGNLLENALSQYSSDPTKPTAAWEPFNHLFEMLNTRSSKRSSLALDMKEISPILARMTATKIPLPGREGDGSGIKVHSVARPVSILPTKTRPKKLMLVGSDGNRYVYLFKGLEDLHLDERIMQFLRICNMMLADKKKRGNSYSARHYSVTPLGSRSGLIQWVEGATPLFSLYRKWQIREASGAAQGPVNVTKPSELYYGKLAPALEQMGVKDLDNRQKWPVSALRSVLTELMAETPKDLLAKELWCGVDSAEGWWTLCQRFARSVAVMSVIGYVIGLGDRHLDNVLVDLKTGDVVHIDYNICFEKGRNLRVPETIPFRMTPTIKSALGPTGVEGVFRLSCEDVLRVLKAGRETLMTLLEAFVYDPLVDWASTQDVGTASFLGTSVVFTVYGAHKSEEGQKTALELANKMFGIRQKELGVPWLANKNSLQTTLMSLVESLGGMSAVQEEVKRCSEEERSVEDDIAVGEGDLIQLNLRLSGLQQKQKILSDTISTFGPDLQHMGQEVRSALGAHHRMMLDIRYVLKSLAKLEEQNKSSDQRFLTYIGKYKDFSEQLAGCLRIIGDRTEWEITEVRQALNGLTAVLSSLDQIYDALLNMKKLETIPVAESGVPVEGRQREERNVQAMSVWRRVKLKLDGKDPAPDKKSSVQEQVEFMIKEATSLDNLALMYEGWTSWV